MITKQDDNGNTTTYEYDELNRLIKKTYGDGTFVSYTHHCLNSPPSIPIIGQFRQSISRPANHSSNKIILVK